MPANNSYANALDITLLPFTIAQDPGSAVDELWYKYTGQPGDVAIGFLGELNVVWSPGHYLPNVTVYAVGPAPYLGGLNQADGAIQVPIANTVTLYFQISNVVGTYTAGDLVNVSVLKPNYNALSDGDILINDDTNGFPAIVFNSAGQVSFADIVAGERGAILLDGTFALQDRSSAGFNPGGSGVFGNNVKIYKNLVFVADVAGVIADTDRAECVILDDRNNNFYVIQNPNVGNPVMRTVSKLGVVGASWTIPSAAAISSAGIDLTRNILYLQTVNLNSSIRRFDLITSLFLSDLVAGPGADWESGKEILVMSDGSIVAKYFNESVSPNESRIYHYEDTGLLRYNKAYADSIQFVNRLAYNRGSTTNYAVWFYISLNASGLFISLVSSRFKFLSTVDGSESGIFNIQNYEIGLSTGTTYWDRVRFGPSTSCPFLVIPVVAPPTPPNVTSGIYKLVPGKRQDTLWNENFDGTTDVKIPNPTGRTGYVA